MKTIPHELYRAPLTVWVEDKVSQAVLQDLWVDNQISVLVAGGKPGVQHLVRGAPRSHQHQVHGIVDRDFDDGNEDDWPHPDRRILRTTTHEIENLLLDFDVLATLSKGESAEQIQERAQGRARDLLFWMVCKAMVREMQRHLAGGFPDDPPQDRLRSVEDVEQHIFQHRYWDEHRDHWGRWSQPAEQSQVIREVHERLRPQLDSEGWRSTFPGKEIFKHLRSYVGGLDDSPARTSRADRDLNLAKRIARKMRELGKVPPAITRMREVLRAKAGL